MKRPLGVTLLALFEFLKAGFLLVLMAIVSKRPEALLGAGPSLRLLISLATSHIVTTASHLVGKSVGVTLLFPLYSVIGVVFGCGLWFMKSWARTVLMWISGIYIVRYLQAIVFYDLALGRPTILAELTFTFFAVVHAIILMYLLSEGAAFGATG